MSNSEWEGAEEMYQDLEERRVLCCALDSF